MLDYVNTWQFNLIGFLIANVIFFQFYKVAIQQAKNDGAATILLQTVAGIAVLVLAPFMPLLFSFDPLVLGLLLLACIFYAITDRLQTTARKHLEVSVFSILNQFLNIFLIVYGFTVFQEPVTEAKIYGAMLILVGNILIFYKKGRFTIDRYSLLSVMASFTLATAISIDIGISKNFNLPIYIMLTLLIPGLFIALAERIPLKTIMAEYNHVSFRYYLAAGIGWAFTIFFSLRSLQLGEVSVVIPLQATAVLLNVIVATIVHKEYSHMHRKVIAAMFVILGVYVTTLTL